MIEDTTDEIEHHARPRSMTEQVVLGSEFTIDSIDTRVMYQGTIYTATAKTF